MDVSTAVAKCMDAMANDVRKTTVFISDKLVVSVCRRHKFARRALMADFVLKIGRPNYEQREFIKRCKKAGVPLPLRRVQLKFWPKAARR